MFKTLRTITGFPAVAEGPLRIVNHSQKVVGKVFHGLARSQPSRQQQQQTQTSLASMTQAQSLTDPESLKIEKPLIACEPRNFKASNRKPRNFSFDICPERATQNCEEASVGNGGHSPELQVLMPGMVLMKWWISPHDQVQIVNTCRELGLAKGGFYRPSFGRRKMHLRMMCLGSDWDPLKKSYSNSRRFDGAVPPDLPERFVDLCRSATLAASEGLGGDQQGFVPLMVPDVCIVNFYDSEFGRLGMHQDIDESKESISKGLPVVSFSVGDSAEFVYGVDRDLEAASTVILESGDVLIFGGSSRQIFHGVSRVFADTAPPWLLSSTGLRPGRLNLTFRKI